MTFILAIQLEDSVIVATDNKMELESNGELKPFNINKMFTWNQGIITGTGEYSTIKRAINIFKKEQLTETFPNCLKFSRLYRELELLREFGIEHHQVRDTKILYTNFNQCKAQLTTLIPDENGNYKIRECSNNEILIWLFNPNIKNITENIKNLYLHLKPFKYFQKDCDWINYYINQLTTIFKIQSKEDSKMSASFTVFFQNKNNYTFQQITNISEDKLIFIDLET